MPEPVLRPAFNARFPLTVAAPPGASGALIRPPWAAPPDFTAPVPPEAPPTLQPWSGAHPRTETVE